MNKRRYIPRSSDTWFKIPPDMRMEFKNSLVERFGQKCVLCSEPFGFEWLTIDHIVPISMGGPVCDIGNMRLACVKCHRRLHGR